MNRKVEKDAKIIRLHAKRNDNGMFEIYDQLNEMNDILSEKLNEKNQAEVKPAGRNSVISSFFKKIFSFLCLCLFLSVQLIILL